MSTWMNREAWWAVDRKRVVHGRVVGQDLQAVTLTVLLDNGARHEAPAYDVHLTQDAAEMAVDLAKNGGGK